LDSVLGCSDFVFGRALLFLAVVRFQSGANLFSWTSKTPGSVAAKDLQQTLQYPIAEEVHEGRHKGENGKDDIESSFSFRVHAPLMLRLPSSPVRILWRVFVLGGCSLSGFGGFGPPVRFAETKNPSRLCADCPVLVSSDSPVLLSIRGGWSFS
jgi:hypothetical protein